MVKFTCNKLVRDNMEILKSQGIVPHYKILEGSELYEALKSKLIEEALEVKESIDRKDIISELADVLEVINGFCKAYQISPEEIESVRLEIIGKRGGFENGIFMEFLEMDDNNPRVEHFRKFPDKYPEIREVKTIEATSNKAQLIEGIIGKYLLNDYYYGRVFNVFNKEYIIDLLKTDNYKELIDSYKYLLSRELAKYLDMLYCEDEICSMSSDENSLFWHRMNNEEYKNIIFRQTRAFSIDLRTKLEENKVYKRTFWNSLKSWIYKN